MYAHLIQKHTAAAGRIWRLDMDESVMEALSAAVQVAFDDPDSVPSEYADAADELLALLRWEGRTATATTREP